MKTMPLAAAAFVAVALLTACHTEQEYHYTAIHRPKGLVGEVFADQLVDSICFTAFDSWTLQSSTSWAKVSPVADENHGNVPSGYYVQPLVPVYFEANNTGEERLAEFKLTSYEADLTVYFKQLPHHNVARPTVVDTEGNYTVSYAATEKIDSLVFTAYSAWTVAVQPDEAAQWISFVGATQGNDGRHIVKYTVAAMDDADEDRTATILLSGNSRPTVGVTTKICVAQTRPQANEPAQ